MTIDHLLVIWGAPSDGGRHAIGHLTREPSGAPYRFWYERDLSAAIARGFTLFPSFPEHRKEEHPFEARSGLARELRRKCPQRAGPLTQPSEDEPEP